MIVRLLCDRADLGRLLESLEQLVTGLGGELLERRSDGAAVCCTVGITDDQLERLEAALAMAGGENLSEPNESMGHAQVIVIACLHRE